MAQFALVKHFLIEMDCLIHSVDQSLHHIVMIFYYCFILLIQLEQIRFHINHQINQIAYPDDYYYPFLGHNYYYYHMDHSLLTDGYRMDHLQLGHWLQDNCYNNSFEILL